MPNDNPEEEPHTTRSEILLNVLIVAAVVLAAYFRWDLFQMPVMFVVTLGVLVAIHEWGHFIAAKAAGVRVYEFALGFGPRLITYMRRGGTDYTIRLFPLGGFVNPKGMQPDDPITPDGINGRRPAERALVYLAGPLMNVILGVLVILLLGWTLGTPDDHQVLVGEVRAHTPARKMTLVSQDGQPVANRPSSLETGDRILAVNDHPVHGMRDVVDQIWPSAGHEVTVKLAREGHELVLKGVPVRAQSSLDSFLTVTRVPADSTLGVQVGDQVDRIDDEDFDAVKDPEQAVNRILQQKAGKPISVTVWRKGETRMVLHGTAAPLDVKMQPGTRFVGQLGFGQTPGQGPRVSLAESVDMGKDGLINFARAIYGMFSRPKVLKENVGGPLAIWVALGKVSKLPPMHYFNILASLSLSLAIFNLLPIPMLDGGHMLLLTLEVLRRRRLEPEAQKVVALVGVAIIGILFFLILAHDLHKVG